jgi:hypothetical protein
MRSNYSSFSGGFLLRSTQLAAVISFSLSGSPRGYEKLQITALSPCAVRLSPFRSGVHFQLHFFHKNHRFIKQISPCYPRRQIAAKKGLVSYLTFE